MGRRRVHCDAGQAFSLRQPANDGSVVGHLADADADSATDGDATTDSDATADADRALDGDARSVAHGVTFANRGLRSDPRAERVAGRRLRERLDGTGGRVNGVREWIEPDPGTDGRRWSMDC